MSGVNMSAIDAAVVCLRVMRRLLQDEEVTLAQLNYLIENIHDPLAQACLPPSQRPIVPAFSLSIPPSSSRPSSTTRQHCVNALSRTHSQANEIDKTNYLHQSPQPTVKASRGDAKWPGAVSPAASKHSSSPIVSGASAKPPAPQIPLTFSQYWDLFSNLPTLYVAQMTLVKLLEGVLQRLQLLIDDLQPSRETVGAVSPLPDNAVLNHHSNSSCPASPEAHAAPTPIYGNGSTRKHVSALRFSNSSSISGNRGVYGEIGIMVNEFFGSEQMKHYMAEHMMYTVKYTQRAAPQLLRLSRVWRWTGGAQKGDSSGVSAAAALASLSDADRTMLLQYSRFLNFLWQSLGRDGTPQDSRVSVSPSLEFTFATAKASAQTEMANTTFLSDSAANAGGNIHSNNGQRRARTTTTTGTAASSSSSGAHRSALPPIPAMWKGFRTILTLLATPLGGLRRYSHVARCLIESGSLQPKDRDRLQESFIDVAALRMSEETNLVMEELWTHDAASIMALMDIPGSRFAGDKAGMPASSRRVGAGGVGAAGMGGIGQHNGHTIAHNSVAGTGGTAAAAISTSAAASPYPAVVRAGSCNIPSADCSNRVLIHYGRLSKRFGRGRHERLAFLFNDWMCYVEECSNGRFRVRGTIPLPGLRVAEVRNAETSDAMHGFELLSPNLPKRLIFFAASLEQRGQWVEAIRCTVRRFCDQHHPRYEETATARSSAVTNLSVIAPAATMGETGLPSVMRATAPMLSAKSRLSRQHRYDGVLQDYLDGHRRMAEAFTQNSPILAGVPSVSLGGTAGGGGGFGFGSVSSAGHSPPLPSLSGDPSRDSSFAGQRSISAHRQLDYDVTPWSQQASMHRRIRSQDLLVAHQQQQGTASSSHTASTIQSAGTRLNMSLSAGPEEMENTTALPAGSGSMGDVPNLESVASLPGLAEEGHAAAQPSTPLFTSSSKRSPRKSLDRTYSNSLRPALLEASGSASTRIGSNTGLGTPLRRPVSERFEAVSSIGNGSQMNSPTQRPQQQQHRSNNSLLIASGPPSSQSMGAIVADAGLPRVAAALPPTSGAVPSDPGRAEGAKTDFRTEAVAEKSTCVDSVDPNAEETVSPSPEPVAEEQVVVDDSTTELSAPVEGEEEEEEHLEVDSTFDAPSLKTNGKRASHDPDRTSGPQRLYSDVLNDFTAPQAEEEEESSRNDAGSGDSNATTPPPGSLLLTASTEQDSASQSGVPVSEKSLSTLKEDDVVQRNRHVDPMVDVGVGQRRN